MSNPCSVWTLVTNEHSACIKDCLNYVVCMCPSAAMSSQYKCQPIWSSLGIAELKALSIVWTHWTHTMSTMSICCRNCGDGCSSGITGILKARQSLSIQIHLPSFAMVVVLGIYIHPFTNFPGWGKSLIMNSWTKHVPFFEMHDGMQDGRKTWNPFGPWDMTCIVAMKRAQHLNWEKVTSHKPSC